MPVDIATGATPPAPYPLQFIDIQITPLIDGAYSVAMQATLLDEEQLEFVGQDLAHEQVKTLDEALTVIRQNVVAPLGPASPA
jgi:hypothetical protein